MRSKLCFVLAICAAATSAGAPPREGVAIVQPSALPRIATIDDRFQSYNVEMAEIIGGNFWKPYGPGETLPSHAGALGLGVVGQDPNLFQKMAPLDSANPRLRRLAAALGPAYVRVSGTWANSVYFDDSNAPPAKAPAGFNGVLTRAGWKGALEFARAADAEMVSSFTISQGVRDRNGVWSPGEAAKWLAYTRSVGGRIAAAEFFNEPTMPVYGGSPPGYDARIHLLVTYSVRIL